MIDPIVELKVLLNIIYHADNGSQLIERSKKRVKELIIQLKLDDIQKDFE
jgi:hypothetical protein